MESSLFSSSNSIQSTPSAFVCASLMTHVSVFPLAPDIICTEYLWSPGFSFISYPSAGWGEGGRGRERENLKQTLCPAQSWTLDLTILRSWPKLKSRIGYLTDWATQAPPYPILLINTFAFRFPTVLAMGNLHTNPFMILSLTIFSSLIICYPSLPLSIQPRPLSPLPMSCCVPIKWKHCNFLLCAMLFCGICSGCFSGWSYSSIPPYLVNMNSKVISLRLPFWISWFLIGRTGHIPLLCVLLNLVIVFCTYLF